MKRTVFMSGLLGCGDGKRFVVRADEKLTAFIELEWAIGLTRKGGGHIAFSQKRIEIENSS